MENMRQMYSKNSRTMCECVMPDDRNRNSRSYRMDSNDRCDCNNHRKNDYVDKMPLAMAYVPWQEWDCVYEAVQGIQAGTIFPELEMPFYGPQCGCGKRGDRV